MEIIYWIILLFIVGIVLIKIILRRRRVETLRKISQMIGFTYHEDPGNLLKELDEFSLFSKGSNREISNLLIGKKNGLQWKIIDYSYEIGALGRHKYTYSQTVAIADLGKRLPRFHISSDPFDDKTQDIIASKVHDIWGLKKISLKDNPEFSKKYHLKGRDEKAVKKLFTPKIISFFMEKDQPDIEVNGKTIICYMRNHKLAPYAIISFIDNTTRIVNIFRQASK